LIDDTTRKLAMAICTGREMTPIADVFEPGSDLWREAELSSLDPVEASGSS